MTEPLFEPTNVLRILQDLAHDVEQGYKDSLERNDRVASGDLLRSVSTEITVNGTTYAVWMNLADYWEYVENDTKPHWPPKSAIDRWIFIKPVIPRPGRDGRIPSPESLSFLIRRKIAREGTEGTHDLEKTKDAIIPHYEALLLEALERDALNYIEKVLP